MRTIRDTCNRALWIEKGELLADGPALEVIRKYQAYTKAEKAKAVEEEPG